MSDELTKLNTRARQQQLAEIDHAQSNAKKNHDFVQLNRSGADVIGMIAFRSGLAIAILNIMMKRMRWDNTIMISREAMAHVFGVSNNTISRAIKVLVDNHIIKIRKVGRSNIYTINVSLVWSTHANLKGLADFSRTLCLDPDDAARLQALDKTVITSYNLHT